MSMQLKLITSFEEMMQARQSWNELAGDHPFLNWEWMVSWWETFGQQGQLQIFVAIDQSGRWLGLAPMFLEKTSWGSSQIRLLSSGQACADYSGLIARDEFRDQFIQLLVRSLADDNAQLENNARFDLIDLEGLQADCESIELLSSELQAAGFLQHSDSMEHCWVAELKPTWEEFNQDLSKAFRRKTKKAVQKLSDENTLVKVCDTAEHFEEMWSQFVDLHQRRRAMLGQPGCFAESEFEQFLKKAIWRMLERKAAAIISVYIDNNPFAAGLILTNKTHAYMYQSGIDVDRIKMEPGHVLNTAMIQYAIEQGKSYFDFLRGDEPYKERWNASPVKLSRLRFVPNKLSAQVRHKIWAAARGIKHWATSTGWFSPQS